MYEGRFILITRKFGDLNLPLLGLGNMRLPVKIDGNTISIDSVKVREMIDYAMGNKMNYYDTAYFYHGGESEPFLGEALSEYSRESYFLATKYNIDASADYKLVFEKQLSRLRTDYIDFYLIHSIFDHSFQRYLDSGCIEYFLKLQRMGKIHYFGFSTHANIPTTTALVSRYQWDFAMIQMNYYDWLYGNAKQEYELMVQNNIPIMVMEPLKGGFLASLPENAKAILKKKRKDWSATSWAFHWLKKFPDLNVILSGMSTLEQLKENIAALSDNEQLDSEDEVVLAKVCEHLHGGLVVHCTGCRYCSDLCPVCINVPRIIKIYNHYKSNAPFPMQDFTSDSSEVKLSDCKKCGLCNKTCPQGIDVMNIITELSAHRLNLLLRYRRILRQSN